MTLSAGTHHFDFTLTEGSLYVGSIDQPALTYLDYTQYLVSQSASDLSGFSLTLAAEAPTPTRTTSVRPTSDRGLTVTPYDTYCLLLNVLGGES